ncbi:MAG: hypothetical protein QOG04_1811 [Actinomycetota bacterium]|jgi:hypothetical protein|nr:hypothetical protein [Actinomycetota bacterium]
MATDSPPHDLAIDRLLAVYDVRSHHSIEVDAAPAAVYQAVRELDLGRSLPVAALMFVRTIPRLLTGKVRPSRSITLEDIVQAGFTILEERPPNELVIGAVGRFWRPDSGVVPVTVEEFGTFNEPGFARSAMSFAVEERGEGSLLATETRVACTDASARRKFSLYWRAIGPFSGLIRRIVLADIKRAAEKVDPGEVPRTGVGRQGIEP